MAEDGIVYLETNSLGSRVRRAASVQRPVQVCTMSSGYESSSSTFDFNNVTLFHAKITNSFIWLNSVPIEPEI